MAAFFSAACQFESFELHSMCECYLPTYLIREILIGLVSAYKLTVTEHALRLHFNLGSLISKPSYLTTKHTAFQLLY